MTKTSLRLALVLGALFVVAIALAACGSSSESIPSNAVAIVGEQPITMAEYQHGIATTAKGAQQPGMPSTIPDPPSYTKCITALRKISKPAKGEPAPSNAAFKAQCKTQYEQLMTQAVGTLIQDKWISGAGKENGISISSAEVQKLLQKTKKQSFKTKKAYQAFLKQSGMTSADVLERLRVQAISQKLEAKFQKTARESVKQVSNSQIKDYYEKHKHQYWVPETRDTEWIITDSQKRANEALNAVEGGMSWAKAVKKYSTAPETPTLNDIAAPKHEHRFDLVFKAKQGEIVGPTKDSFGWSIYHLTAIHKAYERPLKEVSEEIRQQLNGERESQISANLREELADFQKSWKDKTNCREGYIVQLCKNAPAPKSPGGAAGGAPAPESSTPGSSTTTPTK